MGTPGGASVSDLSREAQLAALLRSLFTAAELWDLLRVGPQGAEVVIGFECYQRPDYVAAAYYLERAGSELKGTAEAAPLR